jgi:ATP adenylyltransferase
MDHLWSPWRYQYLTESQPSGTCIFCLACEGKDADHFVVHRGLFNFILLNLYPYTTGHLLIAPREHVPTLELASEESVEEMIRLARTSESHLRAIYQPHGFNIGMNIGASAGAGIAGHIHMHVVPRWGGDSNFMTTVGETRVMPEDLPVTYEKLKRAFQGGTPIG